MNTPVKFELAKLLKEKGFDEPTTDCYNLNGLLFSNGWCEYIADDPEFDGLVYPNKLKEKDVLTPTIAEVVMWLYEKHGIWISVEMTGSKKFYPRGRMIDKTGQHHVGDFKVNGERLICNSPTEAYEAAIEYTLNNLIS